MSAKFIDDFITAVFSVIKLFLLVCTFTLLSGIQEMQMACKSLPQKYLKQSLLLGT